MADVYEEGEVIEPEEYRDEAQTFNHQALVMKAFQKIIECGAKELREGWWEEKTDKLGNVHKTYHEDTRKEFIGSVKSAMMVLAPDFDKTAEDNINTLLVELAKSKAHWLSEEWNWYCSLNPMQQREVIAQGKNAVKGMFNKKNDFDNYFFDEETNIYWEIAVELSSLTKRLDYFGQVDYIA